jgi:hypothetical protein
VGVDPIQWLAGAADDMPTPQQNPPRTVLMMEFRLMYSGQSHAMRIAKTGGAARFGGGSGYLCAGPIVHGDGFMDPNDGLNGIREKGS